MFILIFDPGESKLARVRFCILSGDTVNVNRFLGVLVGGGGGGGSDGLSIVFVFKNGLAPTCKLSFNVGFTPPLISPSVLSTTVRSKLLACVWGVGVGEATTDDIETMVVEFLQQHTNRMRNPKITRGAQMATMFLQCM